jgi:hypothetical protein
VDHRREGLGSVHETAPVVERRVGEVRRDARRQHVRPRLLRGDLDDAGVAAGRLADRSHDVRLGHRLGSRRHERSLGSLVAEQQRRRDRRDVGLMDRCPPDSWVRQPDLSFVAEGGRIAQRVRVELPDPKERPADVGSLEPPLDVGMDRGHRVPRRCPDADRREIDDALDARGDEIDRGRVADGGRLRPQEERRVDTFERGLHGRGVDEVAEDEIDPVGHRGLGACERSNALTGGRQLGHEMAADTSGRARDEDHRSIRRWARRQTGPSLRS